MNLVERLRHGTDAPDAVLTPVGELCVEAANEIESLQLLIGSQSREVARQAGEIERLTAELKTERCLSFRDQVAEMDAELVKTRDLAEHWAILAEQRRVELGEYRSALKMYANDKNLDCTIALRVLKEAKP